MLHKEKQNTYWNRLLTLDLPYFKKRVGLACFNICDQDFKDSTYLRSMDGRFLFTMKLTTSCKQKIAFEIFAFSYFIKNCF